MTTINRTFESPIGFEVGEKLVLKYEVSDISNTIINGVLVVLYDQIGKMLFQRHLEHFIEHNAVILEPILFDRLLVAHSIRVIFY